MIDENNQILTTEEQYVLSLLRKSIGIEKSLDDTPGDLKSVEQIILRNGILLTVYYSLPAELQAGLSEKYHAAIKQSVLQGYEGNQVLHALSDAGLDSIGLKGWELRKLYPDTTMRQMADLDILVKPYDYDRIKSVMDGLGFSSGSESSWKHDGFKKNEVNIEMHKRLTDDSGVIREWERGIWERAKPLDGHILLMSPEDFYIFHFVHMHKDFLNGSLGLRRIVDTWLLQKQPEDMEPVRLWLEQFGMWEFHEKMVKLAHATMGETDMDEGSEFLLSHAFTHGIYGSVESYKAGRIAAMGDSVNAGKVKSAVAAVFLPVSRMKAQFPVLEKYPILLPWCWTKRIMHFLKGNLQKSKAKMDYSSIGEEEFEEMKKFFEAGGV